MSGCYILGLLLLCCFTLCTSITVETTVKTTGPSVCLTSSAVVTKYVNVMCEHKGILYVGGQDVKKYPEGNYLSVVSSMHCPEDEDYIYLGGVFENITKYTQNTTTKYDKDVYTRASSYNGDKLKGRIRPSRGNIFDKVTSGFRLVQGIKVYDDPFKDIDYVPQNVNNFVKLNTNTWLFEEVRETPEDKKINVDGEQKLLPGIVNVNETSSDTPSVVRTILCPSNHGKTCDTMYLGGLFTHVYGTKAGGLAKIQKVGDERVVTEILDTKDTGIIMDVSQYDGEGALAVAGIFGPSDKDALEEDEPGVALDQSVQIVYSDGMVKCFISTDMLSMDQCRRKNAPENCCEKVMGPGHVVEHVAQDEVVVGGSFSVSGTMKFEPANEPPAGGVPSSNPGTPGEGGGAPDDVDSGDDELKSSNEPGYQNFQRLFIPRLSAQKRIDDDHAEEVREKGKLTGGPNGEVMDIKCTKKEDEYNNLTASFNWRCTELLVSGRFDTWEAFFWNDTTMAAEVNETGTIKCNQGIAKLYYNNETSLYVPVRVHDTDESIEIPQSAYPDFNYSDPLVDKEEETDDYPSVNVIHKSNKGAIYGGGEFAKFNNLFSLTQDTFTALINPGDSSDTTPAFAEGDIYYECNKRAANATNRRAQMTSQGADFCCKAGSYCPDEAADIACPSGWGYHCTWDSEPEVCLEGHFCETPGSEIECPVRHTCRNGSVTPWKCDWWEFCEKEGLVTPQKISAIFFICIVISILVGFGSMFVFVYRKFLERDLKRLKKEADFRFNAFSANASIVTKSEGRSDNSTIDGMEMRSIDNAEDDDMPPANPELENHGTSSTVKFFSNPFAKGRPTMPGGILESSLKNLDAEFDSTQSGRRRFSSICTPNMTSRVDIEFRDMSVILSSGQKILNKVSGTLESGTMTAIMGPSGCGKSTTICAIKNGGRVTGDILINNEKTHLMTIQHLIGFVPQDDIMHRDLTVRETLRFQAKLKANPNLTNMQRRAFVNEVLDVLGLTHVQHTLIGDELVRGISGGQRKRVNIGIELMASPLVLFLDEPTSGLDATTTMELIESLDVLAGLGLTIAMVIHQPRMEVLDKIKKLILLQRGGFPVYIGETANALPYFQNVLGLTVPKNTSTADFFLDVITANQTKTFDYGDLTECFIKYTHKKNEFDEFNQSKIRKADMLKKRTIPKAHRPGRYRQVRHHFARSIKQQWNNKRAFIMDSLILIFAGLLAGFVAKNVNTGNNMTVCINGIMSIMSALRVFGNEKPIFLREMQAGTSSFAYFLGKSTANIPILMINPIFFLVSFYKLGALECDFLVLYNIILCINFSSTGAGYMISLVTTPKSAQLAGVVFGLVGLMTSGANPSLRELQSTGSGWLMSKITYGPFAMGSLYLEGSLSKKSCLAVFTETLTFLDDKGYIDYPDIEEIHAFLDLADAQNSVSHVVYNNLNFMMSQYCAYMVLTYLLLFVIAKEEVGGVFNSILYSKNAQIFIEWVLRIWRGDVGGKVGSKLRSERRIMKKSVKLGKHYGVPKGSEAVMAPDATTFAKRFSKTGDAAKGGKKGGRLSKNVGKGAGEGVGGGGRGGSNMV
ncbi:hypothetical protein TL16_g03182 [Triparma laevis f. inornata]|uniref:ABC transporter domain-containing protein n=1 Tax=Triparma laevis f. inornata TaxID=1714386 RepID=A0A9W7A475_9STRA|nr:hypothetical protein TL16_g03182 [Triparma laevis f. inornata]